MEKVNDLRGAAVKDLITKYFYKQNHLCFQILLHLDSNKTLLFGEFTNYDKYKKAFNSLQKARVQNLKISVQNKISERNQYEAKVA